MSNSDESLLERVSVAQEEAEALAFYFARHWAEVANAGASTAYKQLVEALSASHNNVDESTYQELMVSYQKLANYTFDKYEVHGKSVLDTTKQVPTSAIFSDKRRQPVIFGVIFFFLALVFQALDAWTESNLDAMPEFGLAPILASWLPLLIPAAWGALGACTALAKRVSDRLSAMTFEENRMQALSSRIFLGAALALVLDVLVFVEGNATQQTDLDLGFGPIAGAFLAGLFVQHIYGAFESLVGRISKAITPE